MSEEAAGSIGSSFEEFLKEEDIYEEVTAQAVERALAWQIEHAAGFQDAPPAVRPP